jgi:tetratricopeptide (TPR) repeat protein
LGRSEDAIRAWEKALEIEPDYKDARAALGFARPSR